MVAWDANVYYNPELNGLKIIGELEPPNQSYSFDKFVIWGDPETKELFWAEDSGCSCPSPFERYDRAALEHGDEDRALDAADAFYNSRNSPSGWGGAITRGELIALQRAVEEFIDHG